MKLLAIIVCGLQLRQIYVLANPIAGLFDSNCRVVTGECPHENVTFWLYTNETRDKPVQLNPLKLEEHVFPPTIAIKILLHGYTGNRDFSPNTHIRPVLLELKNVYVISIDYGRLVPYPCYFSAVRNLPLASKCLAQLMDNLIDHAAVKPDQLHIIGFSLGAHVAGQTANFVKHNISHITGLDPAKPLFITASSELKLSEHDAKFVDVIHTDVLGRGLFQAVGHVDFYPNVGLYQPGCDSEFVDDPGSCSHDRAPVYYAESIQNNQGFWGNRCRSWFHYVFGICRGNELSIMGYHVHRNLTGNYFLKTASTSPFALGYTVTSFRSGESDMLPYQDVDFIDMEYFEKQLFNAYPHIEVKPNDEIAIKNDLEN